HLAVADGVAEEVHTGRRIVSVVVGADLLQIGLRIGLQIPNHDSHCRLLYAKSARDNEPLAFLSSWALPPAFVVLRRSRMGRQFIRDSFRGGDRLRRRLSAREERSFRRDRSRCLRRRGGG